MTVFIRTDLSSAIGMGHAMRCRTLGQAIHALAPDVPLVFITTTEALEPIVMQTDNMPWYVECYPDEWTAFEGVRSQADQEDILVIDEPAGTGWANSLWRTKLQSVMSLVRIDAPWAEPDSCDLLVLPGMHHSADTIERLDAVFGERLLVGAEYVMLRKEITALPSGAFMHNPWFTFCAGGSDVAGALPLLYTMTASLAERLPHIQRVFCVGTNAPPWSVTHVCPEAWITGYTMSYIREASLFITLWGTTVYEALALGTPTLTIGRTEAEAEDAARMEAATDGAVQSLGTLAGLMRETLCDRLVALWQDAKERKRMHYAGAGLLDGKGAERVARAVLALVKE